MIFQPVFLNEVLIRLPPEGGNDDPTFHLSHIDTVYIFRAESMSEQSTWVKNISSAYNHYIEIEKKRREKMYQGKTKNDHFVAK